MAISLLTLALLGTLSLAGTILLGYRVPAQAGALKLHFLAALGTTTLLVMAHSFVMFFLIATGVSMKELEREAGLGDSFRRRSVALKSRVFPAMTLAILMVIGNFVMGAAAHTRAVPPRLHELSAWSTLLLCAFALWREYLALGENNRLIDEIGARRKAAGPAAKGS